MVASLYKLFSPHLTCNVEFSHVCSCAGNGSSLISYLGERYLCHLLTEIKVLQAVHGSRLYRSHN